METSTSSTSTSNSTPKKRGRKPNPKALSDEEIQILQDFDADVETTTNPLELLKSLYEEHFSTIDNPDEFFKAVISRRSHEFVHFQQVIFNASVLLQKCNVETHVYYEHNTLEDIDKTISILKRKKQFLECIQRSKKIVESFASEYVKFLHAENILA